MASESVTTVKDTAVSLWNDPLGAAKAAGNYIYNSGGEILNDAVAVGKFASKYGTVQGLATTATNYVKSAAVNESNELDLAGTPDRIWSNVNLAIEQNITLAQGIYDQFSSTISGFVNLPPEVKQMMICEFGAELAANGLVGATLTAIGAGAVMPARVMLLVNKYKTKATTLVSLLKLYLNSSLPSSEKLSVLQATLFKNMSLAEAQQKLSASSHSVQDQEAWNVLNRANASQSPPLKDSLDSINAFNIHDDVISSHTSTLKQSADIKKFKAAYTQGDFSGNERYVSIIGGDGQRVDMEITALNSDGTLQANFFRADGSMGQTTVPLNRIETIQLSQSSRTKFLQPFMGQDIVVQSKSGNKYQGTLKGMVQIEDQLYFEIILPDGKTHTLQGTKLNLSTLAMRDQKPTNKIADDLSSQNTTTRVPPPNRTSSVSNNTSVSNENSPTNLSPRQQEDATMKRFGYQTEKYGQLSYEPYTEMGHIIDNFKNKFNLSISEDVSGDVTGKFFVNLDNNTVSINRKILADPAKFRAAIEYEIPKYVASLKNAKNNLISEHGAQITRFGDVQIQSPTTTFGKMVKALTEKHNVRITISDPNFDNQGAWGFADNERIIYLNPDLFAPGREKDLLSVLRHEATHITSKKGHAKAVNSKPRSAIGDGAQVAQVNPVVMNYAGRTIQIKFRNSEPTDLYSGGYRTDELEARLRQVSDSRNVAGPRTRYENFTNKDISYFANDQNRWLNSILDSKIQPKDLRTTNNQTYIRYEVIQNGKETEIYIPLLENTNDLVKAHRDAQEIIRYRLNQIRPYLQR